MGFVLALVSEPAQTRVGRLKKIPMWVLATSLFGVGFVQGSASVRDILRISLWAALIGLILGLVHYATLEVTAFRQLRG
jgi:membrane associated rhomboid family serine protease